jgi:hypothetical protein
MSHENIVERIRAEYLEMPGLRLTEEQARRLCGLERAVCHDVLDALVKARFLSVNAGVYGRATDGAMPRPRPATATLRNDGRLKAAS